MLSWDLGGLLLVVGWRKEEQHTGTGMLDEAGWAAGVRKETLIRAIKTQHDRVSIQSIQDQHNRTPFQPIMGQHDQTPFQPIMGQQSRTSFQPSTTGCPYSPSRASIT